MAKSEHGLPARSEATQMQISREEYELNWDLTYGYITFKEFELRMRKLKQRGLVRRR